MIGLKNDGDSNGFLSFFKNKRQTYVYKMKESCYNKYRIMKGGFLCKMRNKEYI